MNSTSGELAFLVPPDFDDPGDANADNVYELTVRVSDGEHNATLNPAVSVTGINEPPVFTSQPNWNVPEGHATAGELNATDPEDDGLAYSIAYGDDQAKFDLNSSTG